ncbi:MAG: imidazolonepropionase [Ignavibacteriales bacterium]|nr:MAG: imidazolonepropionase [Ignavibacteriales bacterium]
MITLLQNPAQIVTVNTSGRNVKRGKELNDISLLTDHSIIVEDDVIKDLISSSNLKSTKFDKIIDVKDKVILPGLVDCHTHTAFAGSRANEFRMKLNGATYEEISKAGGGIITTVNAVRNSSFEQLVKIVSPRISYYISRGITTLEIKSGYGLDFENEIKLLHLIKYLDEVFPIDIVPTFLGAHTFPLEYKNDHLGYINLIIDQMLPHISKNKLAKFCDGFCESTAFSSNEIKIIFDAARSFGLSLKLHTEQFNTIGGLKTAVDAGAISVDHLEAIRDEDIPYLASTDTTAVLLPGVSLFLKYQYAPARKLIDNNAIVALATDYNPGSSHINDLSLIMSLAALNMKMTIEETISAVTINAARALNLSDDRGSIEINKKADLSIFDTDEYSDIVYNVGKNLNIMTIKNGRIIFDSTGGNS